MNTLAAVRADESQGADPAGKELLGKVQEMVSACIQCGTCTASCPNAFAMDFSPRHLWRLILLEQETAVFDSKTFALCSSCYYCTLRCPRGLSLTEAMATLKQVAAARQLPLYRKSAAFYNSFLESVRRHGRLRETEFMMRYFRTLKNPLLPLAFAPLGMRLMRRGKASVRTSSGRKTSLEALFSKVAQLEGRP